MQYALLIYQAEEVLDNLSGEDQKEALARHRHLQEKTKAKRAFLVANELMSSSTATTVRVRAGKTLLLDGPFAETKEQLIGLYVLECKNLDEAIEYAQLIPNVDTGSIEIRPIAYEDTDHYRVTRRFLSNPERMLKVLIEGD